MEIAITILGIFLITSIYFNLELFKKGLKASEELDLANKEQRKYKQECLNLIKDLRTSKETINKLIEDPKCVCKNQVPSAKAVQKKQTKKPVIK